MTNRNCQNGNEELALVKCFFFSFVLFTGDEIKRMCNFECMEVFKIVGFFFFFMSGFLSINGLLIKFFNLIFLASLFLDCDLCRMLSTTQSRSYTGTVTREAMKCKTSPNSNVAHRWAGEAMQKLCLTLHSAPDPTTTKNNYPSPPYHPLITTHLPTQCSGSHPHKK